MTRPTMRPSRHALRVLAVALLIPGTAFAGALGPGFGVLLAAFLAPVALVLALVQGLVLAVAVSPTVRSRTGVATLVVAGLVALVQGWSIGSDVAQYGLEAFPGGIVWAWAIGIVALTALTLVLGVRLLRK